MKPTIHLDIKKKSSGFVSIFILDFDLILCILQAYLSKITNELKYAWFTDIIKNIPNKVNDQLLYYCPIYYINMRFGNITFFWRKKNPEPSIINLKYSQHPSSLDSQN